jgi:uncharacterized membrane protein YbaN (DUF454 family)
MKRFLLFIGGLVFIAIGLIGLIVPMIPGFVFLLLSAVIFAGLSPRLRRRLDAHPRLHRLFARVDASRHLRPLDRFKLTVWACLEAVTGARRI